MKYMGILAAVVAAVSFGGESRASTLEGVKAKGFVQCGVNTGLVGFAQPDASGDWKGFDIDFCKAIASAVFGDPSKVKYTPLESKERLTALQSGEIDVLSRNTTWTISRDTYFGLNFRPVTYYDGQGFIVHKSSNVKSALELSGATICMHSGTTTELNAADYFAVHKLEYHPLTFEKLDEVVAAYEAGRCDVYSTDQSGLYSLRLTLKKPDDHVVLPEIISKEPLGPVVRQGDDQWFDIVSWTAYALVNAEEFGITRANVDTMKNSSNPDIKRFLGVEAGSKIGTDLGLTNEWAYNIIKGVGNYSEIFERNIGHGSPLKIERGMNALWNKGGIQYAPPVR